MKDLKAFIVIIILTGITYWGVEPYAHSIMHPHVEPANFDFAKEDIELAKSNLEAANKALTKAKATNNADQIKASQKQVTAAKANLDEYTNFWNDINSIDLKKGDVKKGAELIVAAGCTGCHGIEAAGMPAAMDNKSASEAFGVAPPDLSTAGYLYDEKFLAALIKNPPMALKLTHKFGDLNPFPMTSFFGAGGDLNSEVADIVAYLKSIAPKKMDDKDVFINACSRCHGIKYDKVYANGNHQSIAKYLGSNPPDLSMYIRSRSDEYLHNFINDTQKMLPGTAMPRVGLNTKAQEQVIEYMRKVGDSKKDERENLGMYIIIYFLILGVFATLWKRSIWSKLH